MTPHICTATIIADSIPCDGYLNRITTLELEFPRIILAEFNTHRALSRNAASTRAIPVMTQIQYVVNRYFEPSPFTLNQSGMEANAPVEGWFRTRAVSFLWNLSRRVSIFSAKFLCRIGVSKQHAGRILEPYSMVKVVVTATEWANFFWLRRHPSAQPEIRALADAIFSAMENSIPVQLKEGEWHVPYYKQGTWREIDGKHTSREEAIAISASCAAQVSYRKNDGSAEKAKKIYERLVESKPVHASPFEHQATPITDKMREVWVDGITHKDASGSAWSGNFKGWIQHRQLIQDHVCYVYENQY